MEHMFQKCPISFSYKHATFYSSSLLSSMYYVPLALFSCRSLESFESNASPTTTVADKWLLIKVKHTWNNNTSCSSKHTCTSGLATAFNTAPPHVQKQHFLKGLTKRKENWFFAAAILHILLLLHFQFTLPFGGKNTTLVLLAERPFKKQRPQ